MAFVSDYAQMAAGAKFLIGRGVLRSMAKKLWENYFRGTILDSNWADSHQHPYNSINLLEIFVRQNQNSF